MAAATAVTLAATTVTGCGARTRDPTSVVVRVNSDLEPGTQFDIITILVTTARGEKLKAFAVGSSAALPVSLALLPAQDRGERFEVVAAARLSSNAGDIVDQAASTAFVPGAATVLEMMLTKACVGFSGCADNHTCQAGACVPRARTPVRTDGGPDDALDAAMDRADAVGADVRDGGNDTDVPVDAADAARTDGSGVDRPEAGDAPLEARAADASAGSDAGADAFADARPADAPDAVGADATTTPPPPACMPATRACPGASSCCTGLVCGTTSLGQVCCGNYNVACTRPGGEDCCGQLECVSGRCCLPAARPCTGATCCGGRVCGTTSLGRVCCGNAGTACTRADGADCCGLLECVSGVCRAV